MPPEPNAEPTSGNANESAERMVPLAALEAERRERQQIAQRLVQTETAVAELRGRQDAAPAAPAAQKQRFTRTQLNAAVEAGQIQQHEADQLYEQQQAEVLTESITAAVTKSLTTQQQAQQLNAAINRYAAVMPALNNNESPEAQKVVRSFNRLTGTMGYDANDPRTRLLALENALGEIDALEATRHAGGSNREADEEIVGDARPGDDGNTTGRNNDGSPRGMTARQRAYYEDKVGKGIMNWDGVAAELEYQRPGLSQRANERFGRRMAAPPQRRRGGRPQQQGANA